MVTAHSRLVTGLQQGTTYHYRVLNRDAAGNLFTSGDFAFTTMSDPTPPAISAVQAAGVTDGAATLRWTTDEPSTSQIDYGTTASYGTTTLQDTNRVTDHAMTLTGLSAGTLYHYRVKSRDVVGNLATSDDFTFTTGPDVTPPSLARPPPTAACRRSTPPWSPTIPRP
jgi:phosphodiesterase/alkaline phosphatase D-like protein